MDKGLLFRGVNRSAIQDYARALGEMRRPEVRDHLRSLIWHVSRAKGPEDLVEACRLSESPGRMGRVCVDIGEPE
jgi:hypothetical protein